MRCSQCGLPLSPSRTNCPRCATPVGESEKKTEIKYDTPLLPQDTISSTMHEEGNNQQQARVGQSSDSTLVQQYATMEKPQLQLYTQQANRQDGQRNIEWYPSAPTPVSSFPQGTEQTQINNAASSVKEIQRARGARGLARVLPGSTLGTRLGFTVAGLCMGAGALILIFVFIMAQSLSTADSTAIQAANQKSRNKADTMRLPTLQPAPSPTISDVTPMANTPGSKYIDNIQIGTAINMNRVVITQVTKDFKVGQRIYITMNVNSVGYQGAVCLDWYVQDVYVTHYAFATTADPSLPYSTAWSYATLVSKGAGYVDVAWASSTTCVDKVLAQRVDFTIGT